MCVRVSVCVCVRTLNIYAWIREGGFMVWCVCLVVHAPSDLVYFVQSISFIPQETLNNLHFFLLYSFVVFGLYILFPQSVCGFDVAIRDF